MLLDLHQSMQLKFVTNVRSHIVDLADLLEERDQFLELNIVLLAVESEYRDTVGELQTKRLN